MNIAQRYNRLCNICCQCCSLFFILCNKNRIRISKPSFTWSCFFRDSAQQFVNAHRFSFHNLPGILQTDLRLLCAAAAVLGATAKCWPQEYLCACSTWLRSHITHTHTHTHSPSRTCQRKPVLITALVMFWRWKGWLCQFSEDMRIHFSEQIFVKLFAENTDWCRCHCLHGRHWRALSQWTTVRFT